MTRRSKRLGRGMKEIRANGHGAGKTTQALALESYLGNPHIKIVSEISASACPPVAEPKTRQALSAAVETAYRNFRGQKHLDADIEETEKPRRGQPEHDLQVAFFARVRGLQRLVPELAVCHAPKVDFKRTGGLKDFGRWNYLQAEGVVSGVPDVCLPMAINGNHCFYMELKAKGKKPEPHQLAFHELLRKAGASVCWTDDLEQAWHFFLQYVGPLLTERKIEVKGLTY